MTSTRTEQFVPLTNQNGSTEKARDFRVKVMADSGQAKPFQSTPLAEPAPAEVSACLAKHGEPRISLQCEGDRITSIRVQCGCGQVLELACVYDLPAKA